MSFEFNIRRILSYTRRAVDDYGMIKDGDRIAIGVSGGKDSLTLLCAMAALKKFYPKNFELEAITMDPGFHRVGFADETQTKQYYSSLKELCEQLEVNFTLFDTEIAKIIFDVRKEKNP